MDWKGSLHLLLRERFLSKDYTYITGKFVMVLCLELYPQPLVRWKMAERVESFFPDNEFLGHEARLVHLKEEQQKSVQAWTLFLLRKESGSKGALLRSVPSRDPQFALVKITCLHPALFQSCLPDT